MSPNNRWLLHLMHVAIAGAALAIGPDPGARAQPAHDPTGRVAAEPSPFAPGDLKRPTFDTRTPIYDTVDAQTKSAGTVVAEVDGRPITLGEVADAIRALPPTASQLPFDALFPGVLTQLIREQALVVRAQRQGLDEDPIVRRKIKQAQDQVLSNEVLTHEASASITEAALLERYNRDIAGKPGPEEVRVRVIMVPTEQAASAIVTELRNGADFAAIARRSSKDGTAAAGGDAGFVTLDEMTREIGAVVFSLQPGQFTPFPVNSKGSWFVLKTEERRRRPARGFNLERESLFEAMMQEKASDVVAAAVADVTIRTFDISGKEQDASSAGVGARAIQSERPGN